MLCGVTATLGSNPSATATAARPHWGRAVLLCLDGVRARVLGPGCLVCLARPGCLVCPWAAARPRAVRAASFARRVVSKPGQALPPPTGPAAWHRNPLVLSAPSIPAALVSLCVAGRVASKPGQASPPPTGTAAWPSVPSGTLRTGGACVAVCGWARRLEAWPGPAAAHGPRSLAPQPSGPVGTLHTGGACVAVTSPARPYRMGTAAWVSGLSTQWRPVADADWCVGSKRARALRALRRPPHRRRLCRCVWLGASPRSPARPRRRPRAPQPTGSIAWPSRSCGALHAGRANPLRVAVRSRFEVVSCPKCRPPRRKTLKTGCYGRSGLRFGRIGTCHSALLAREPAIASGNPLCRT